MSQILISSQLCVTILNGVIRKKTILTFWRLVTLPWVVIKI